MKYDRIPAHNDVCAITIDNINIYSGRDKACPVSTFGNDPALQVHIRNVDIHPGTVLQAQNVWTAAQGMTK